MRLWPRSLLGQVLLAVAVALLIAQAISAVLLYRSSEQRRESAILHSLAFRLESSQAERHERRERRFRQNDNDEDDDKRSSLTREKDKHDRRLPRALRLEITDKSPLADGEQRDLAREKALRTILSEEDARIGDLVVLSRDPHHDAAFARIAGTQFELPDGELVIAGLRLTDSDQWRVARVFARNGDQRALQTLVVQTAVLYLVLVGILALLLRRITRPLAALTNRVERFARSQDTEGQIEPTGPDDLRRLIAAHNAMEARIAAMLDEKDVMLGAIGHDLKTPLAALRVRIESVEDETERARMAAGIEDITRSLDDILSLARVGRASEPPERTDLGALAAAVVEEFEDMGQPVTLADGPRVVAPVHVTWARRALRNLVSNAVRYGGTAEVSLDREGNDAVLRVSDNGPGIPTDRIADMMEPFARGEASRNRETGGTGLGLTLARAIAEQHGGRLVLTNRPEGGLMAELRLPLG
ncbi:HAMP domain-containing protein [Altererythrobacter sp. FM1]|uniref:ATP-binding protein n=1 Tax=Tsuneonella flava TaxID=2055955 RepID=UPI000C7FAE21|nr:ATP-binding protein [Tsuneonella flava]ROT97006.1 HAMP domain-containing protein [Altererythrobacter sp. FM1]